MESSTSLIQAAEQGDRSAAESLFQELYTELHRLARRELGRGVDVSLGTTTLLHEAYLDMAGRNGPSFPDRARFMTYAARVMRGLIIDHARERRAQKRGGRFEITSIDLAGAPALVDYRELTQVNEALDHLDKADPGLSEVVDLKFFCGFSFAEIAGLLHLSERTVQRRWDKARIYLHQCIRPDLAM